MAKAEVTPEAAAEELLRRRRARESSADYVAYISRTEPPAHSRLLCEYLDMAIERKITRLMVFMPPGHAKSFYISRHFPAYYLSKFPDHSVIAASHTDDFANTWGRRVRNVICSREHQLLFPDIQISEDSRASGRWETNHGGEYNAAGVGGNITGRRSNLALIDDPISGIVDAESPAVRESLWQWYGADFYPRLKKDGIIIIVQTRWHLEDLAGMLIASEKAGGEKWTVLSLPAIALEKDPLGRKVGEALWPSEYPIERLNTIKKQPSMSPRTFQSLYQQSPVLETGNIIKRSWFRIWTEKDPPKCKMIIQSWDTATSKKESAAYSACTTWGIFEEKDTGLPSMILLSAFRKRMDYPELRKMAQRLAYNYKDDVYEFPAEQKIKLEPDIILIEDQSSGSDLIPDLRRAGVSAIPIKPRQYGDKNTRVQLSSDLMENGRIWVPGQPPLFTGARRWAEEFILACVAFPSANSRDFVDCMTQAILRVKKTGFVRNSEDLIEPSYTRIGKQAIRPTLYG